MHWSDLPTRPTQRMLRQFAGLWIVFFGLLALWQWFIRENTTLALLFGALAVTIGPLGLIHPRAIRLIFVTWMVLAFPIGWLVSRVCLVVLFYGLFTPVGLLFRLLGRDVLGLKRRPNGNTYWQAKVLPTDPGRYTRQF